MKSKLLQLFSVAILAVGAVACSSSSKLEPVALEDAPDCVWEGTDRRAPDWTCGGDVEGFPVSGVGTFRSTQMGTAFARQQAAMAGRIEIANEMRVKVGSMVKNYAETTGVGDDETVDAVASSTARQITAETLYGSKPIRYVKGPDGTTYALVIMDETQAANAAKQALKTSYKNDQAQWQKFMAEKSHSELEREMDKMVEQEFKEFNNFNKP